MGGSMMNAKLSGRCFNWVPPPGSYSFAEGHYAKTAVFFFVNSTLLAVVVLAIGVLLKVAVL